MVLGATGEGAARDGAAEQFFDGIYGFFEALVRLGETWGDPWPLVLPVGVAAFVLLILIRGLQSVTGSFERGTWSYVVAFIVIGVLLLAAALNADRLDGEVEDSDDGVDPATTVAGG